MSRECHGGIGGTWFANPCAPRHGIVDQDAAESGKIGPPRRIVRGAKVELNQNAGSHRGRIVPTPNHLEALVGTWELGGEMIQMLEEPDTGILLALNSRGDWVNPMTVITRGSKR